MKTSSSLLPEDSSASSDVKKLPSRLSVDMNAARRGTTKPMAVGPSPSTSSSSSSSRDLCNGLEAMRARIRNLHQQYGDSLEEVEANLSRMDFADVESSRSREQGNPGTVAEKANFSAGGSSGRVAGLANDKPLAATQAEVDRMNSLIRASRESDRSSRSGNKPVSDSGHTDVVPRSRGTGVGHITPGAVSAQRSSGELRLSNQKSASFAKSNGDLRSQNNAASNGVTSLLSYLDTVDQENQQDLAAIDRRSDLRQSSAAEVVADRLSLLEIELTDKRETVQRLRQALDRQKKDAAERDLQLQKASADQLAAQKKECDEQVERQLVLCDRLLKEKTDLTKRISSLAEELKTAERKFSKKVEELQEDHAKDVARQKQNWATSERLRRENWEKEKTKEIKEITIKGLEPEIERILSAHRTEKKRIEEQHQVEKTELQSDLERRYERRLQEAREASRRETDRLLEAEQDRQRAKLDEKTGQISKTHQDERKRHLEDVRQMQETCDKRVNELQLHWEKQLRELQQKFRSELDAKDADLQQLKQKARQEFEQEEKELREKLRLDGEATRTKLEEQFTARVKQAEVDIRAEVQKKRDWEIEQLTTRLGKEQLDLERQFATKLETEKTALWDKMAAEHGALSAKLTAAMEATASAEVRLLEAEKTRNDADTSKDLVTTELVDVKDRLAHALRKADLAESQKQEVNKQQQMQEVQHDREVQLLTEQLKSSQAALADAEQAKALGEKASAEREAESARVLEERVRSTLAKKDGTIEDLKRRLSSKDNQIKECEFMLQKQREELLSGL
ncbi:unnamed protein product [Amoebophrya sp. A120]|nr:unnamed protein product [Amoebophrya sp. A120]|eukprot:GSA120T00011814001.1